MPLTFTHYYVIKKALKFVECDKLRSIFELIHTKWHMK